MTAAALTKLPSPASPAISRRLPLIFFAAVVLFYLAFSPGTIEGMGYYGENLTAADKLAANLIHVARGQSSEPMKWTRHGGLELIFELPFAFVNQLVFGGSVKWLGRMMALQTILATGLLCALLFAWVRRLTGSLGWSYALALTAALATMFWPYAYIGLETTQSVCLFGAAYLALGRPARQRQALLWPEVMAMAFCCACAVGVKLNGGFLFPAVVYLLFHYFRAQDARRALKAAVAVVFILSLYVLNYHLKTLFWADTAGGSTAYFLSMLVSDPATALIQSFSYFGSANKSLLIYAPVIALSLWKLPEAFRIDKRTVIFALLVLGGLIGGFSLVTVWTEETWGPRYLHSAIAPLMICLAVAKSAVEFRWRREKALIALALLGFITALPGAVVTYGSLHHAASVSSHSTLTALQYDPAWNHIRFNYKLLGIWAEGQFGKADQPVMWPPPQKWWFERPADAAPERTVDLREWAMPQSVLLRGWTPLMKFSPRQHLLLRLLLAGCLGLSVTIFGWMGVLLRRAKWQPLATHRFQNPDAHAEGNVSPGGAPDEAPLVAICMASWNPPLALFRRQILSIRQQTYRNWVCVISDDASAPEQLAQMRQVIGDDARFVLSPSPERLGVFRNFERCLMLAPTEARYLAFTDQDDDWYPEKVGTLLAQFDERTTLVYSDMRIVREGGEVISETYWTARENNYQDFASLLLTNTITGAASMFDGRLRDQLLPFPALSGTLFHDHWVACVSRALGEVKYIDRPLYDYVQHGSNVLGYYAASSTPSQRLYKIIYWMFLEIIRITRGEQRAGVIYAENVLPLMAMADAILLREHSGLIGLQRGSRRVLQRMARLDRSLPSIIWLFMHGLKNRRLRNPARGAEYHLLQGVFWKLYARFKFRR